MDLAVHRVLYEEPSEFIEKIGLLAGFPAGTTREEEGVATLQFIFAAAFGTLGHGAPCLQFRVNATAVKYPKRIDITI
jgi:hypothetical protein